MQPIGQVAGSLRTEAKSAPTAMQRLSSPSSEVGKLLLVLAEARQTSVSPQTIQIYCKALASFQYRDIATAINRLSLTERPEGQTAFPQLGTIVSAIKLAAVERRSRATIERINADERARQERPQDYVYIFTDPDWLAVMERAKARASQKGARRAA